MNSGPKPHALRAAIADSISANLKSYDVAAYCVSLGLAPQGDDDPFRSKASYVRTRLVDQQLAELVDLAGRILAEWDDERLQQLVDAAVTPRRRRADEEPHLRRRRAEAPDHPPGRHQQRRRSRQERRILPLLRPAARRRGGLRWSDLVDWWAAILHTDNTEVAGRDLWRRLDRSLDSEPEHLLFRWYTNPVSHDA